MRKRAIALANMTLVSHSVAAVAALQEALRSAPPAHQARLLAAMEHHPVAQQAEAMKQLVGALQAINRTGAKVRTEEGYMSWTRELPE